MTSTSNSKLFIIIQARMTSTRLPKKVLLPLCGKTVLEVMFDRLEAYKENIIIATTDDGSETLIVNLCKELEIKYYRGSTHNVLSRYYKSALANGASTHDIIVRLTSDCPLIDQEIVGNTINHYKNGNYEYVSNRINRKVPVGLDVEVFSFSALEEAYLNASKDYEKEHVTPYIYMTKKSDYRIGSYEPKVDGSQYRLTLDEEDDYLAIQEIYKKFHCRTNFTYEVLIDTLKKNPFIYNINSHVEQKKV